MVGQEPLSPGVRVFMTEEEALFYEMECGDSQREAVLKGPHFLQYLVLGHSLRLEWDQVVVKLKRSNPRKSK